MKDELLKLLPCCPCDVEAIIKFIQKREEKAFEAAKLPFDNIYDWYSNFEQYLNSEEYND